MGEPMLIRWQRTIVDQRGNVQPGAVLTIRRMSDQAIVTVYRDGAGLDPYPTGSVTADENGYAYFYAAPGLYRITSIQPSIDWPDVSLSAPVVNVGGQTYESIADGLAATTDGEFFSVSPSIYPGGLFDVYRNDAGSAELVGTQPSLEAVDELRAKTEQSLLGPYADTTEGMGHAAEGQYFYVESDGGDLELYRNVGGAATLQGVYPDGEALNSAINELRAWWNKSAVNFRFSPYASFDDGIDFGIVDQAGYKLDSDTLLRILRTMGTNVASPYLSFDDGEAFLMTDRYGRVLGTGGGTPAPAPSWGAPIYVQYIHASKELYVSWVHDRSMMFRVLWKPNGHNSLFNFRAIWWATVGNPASASWNLIQEVVTDYIPPITHHATTGATSPNVSTTGGNHSGANGEITAVMQYCRMFIGGAELSDDWVGYTTDVTASWQNLLYAGNTVNEQRFTTQQDVRARFSARTTEIVCKVTALEPIMIWREGGTQMVGTGWDVSYHFYGGIQQGSVAADSGVLDSGTKAQAPDVWACVLTSDTLGYAAAWLDRSYGIGSAGVTDADYMAAKQTGPVSPATYKFYNFPIKFEALPHYVMDTGDSYTWRGGYSYAPLGLVSGLDSGFLFTQNGRLRIALANTAAVLGGTVVLPDDIPSTDFETIGGLDSIGVPVSFGAYSAQAYKEVN